MRTEFWLALSPSQFEGHVARLFEGLGWSAEIRGGKGDRGVDVYLFRGDRIAVVQCKAYKNRVGPSAVRDLHSAMITARAHRGFLVSLRGFSDGAVSECMEKPILLLHAVHLANIELSVLSKNLGRYFVKEGRLLWDTRIPLGLAPEDNP